MYAGQQGDFWYLLTTGLSWFALPFILWGVAEATWRIDKVGDWVEPVEPLKPQMRGRTTPLCVVVLLIEAIIICGIIAAASHSLK